jgi:hypothetical protein
MVINMDETKLRTNAQIEDFIAASTLIEFSAYSDNTGRYGDTLAVVAKKITQNRGQVLQLTGVRSCNIALLDCKT